MLINQLPNPATSCSKSTNWNITYVNIYQAMPHFSEIITVKGLDIESNELQLLDTKYW